MALKKAEPSKRPGLKYQWRQLLGAAQTLRTTVHIDMVQHYAQHPFNIQMRGVNNQRILRGAQRGHGTVAVKGIALAYLLGK